ncbi:MAG TPA: N-6 DNA methylase [Phycisphaerae bacterium]|nr:N-6 DNA methylase [Phycisphaerae bacterium]
MNYPSIRIEGAILSPDILGRIEELPGQRPSDFGLDAGTQVKDEIARAWADAQDYWRIFQRKLGSLKSDSNATTETRNFWMVPLLGLLRYDIEYQPRGTKHNGQIYAISHRITNRANASLNIIGYRDPAGLDKKPTNATRRMSAHALVQEFLNLHKKLYGLVTDGRVLRLLRDSSRLIKLSYLEFDLDRIFTDGLFADFAVLFRLLHATRLPLTNEGAAESLIERYHQDSLDSGARIRNGLSNAVEDAIRDLGSGFLAHPENGALRRAVADGDLTPEDYYKHLLRLIYRLLFLMVIEERDLIFPPETPRSKRDIYTNYYSVQRLRLLSEKRYLADARCHDLWLALVANFRLFEADGPGEKLGISPLAGDLFDCDGIGPLSTCHLGNDVLLGCLRALSVYEHPDTHQSIRVNYGALNVEEFGSVYEGLLEYEPEFVEDGNRIAFGFRKGDERAATGSHYTPDDLVQPLVKHSLDYLIEERLKEDDPEAALLDLRVADIACGSGHILLAAARRIATELAIVRTGEEQPSPTAYRAALRDVIRTCIYGVDLNELAVELCKVALWLEAHNPGQPLNFLDHHIKWGNSIVGYVHREDVDKGVPNEAFKTLSGDDKEVAAELRKQNKRERKERLQFMMELSSETRQRLDGILAKWNSLSALPEKTPAEIVEKKKQFNNFVAGQDAWLLNQIAAIPIAQFYVPKTQDNKAKLITDEEFRLYWRGEQTPQGQAIAAAAVVASRKRFFHWFLEFPDIMERGGFDCILGNPPYLGGQALSGTYGFSFCEYVKWKYAPTGLSDLVVFFLRRIHTLLKPGGSSAIITTNSITDGDIRRDGLMQVVAKGGQIIMAIRGTKWPGQANLVVSLLATHKGDWEGQRILDGKSEDYINTFFESGEELAEPKSLLENRDQVFQGSIILGDGFLLTNEQALQLITTDSRNREVVFPAPRGKQDINEDPGQSPGRSIINFHDWSLEKAQLYPEPFVIVETKVKPFRATQNRKRNREVWWIYAEHRPGLNRNLRTLSSCFASVRTTKFLSFVAVPTNYVFTDSLNVFTTDRWDLFAVSQSTLHEVWARKCSGKLETRLRYSPSDCFETFAFPDGLWQTPAAYLARVGERYHEHRKALMLSLWLGLTKIYNLFHARDLSPEMVAKVSKMDTDTVTTGHEGLLELRRLHVELDTIVRDTYGWQDLDLGHDFHEVETLPENDRVRYTISPAARREVLKRLLAENLKRAAAEASAVTTVAKPKRSRKKVAATADIDLFTALSYPATDRDKLICSAALSAVEQTGVLSSMDHLDALLMATHPTWCEVFLSATDKRTLEAAIAKAPAAMFVEDNDSIRWKNSRDYLEQRKALAVDHSGIGQPIAVGTDIAAVKASLSGGVDDVVALALKALERVREFREDVDVASQEQQRILGIFMREAASSGLAVA